MATLQEEEEPLDQAIIDELIAATPELREAIAQLAGLFARYGHRWQRATYVAQRLDDGGWTFQVDFSY